MRLTHRQNEAELSRLHARYRAAWRRLLVEVGRWQTLQMEGQADAISLREAEVAAHTAEIQYRQARNAFADYLLEHLARERESVLVGS